MTELDQRLYEFIEEQAKTFKARIKDYYYESIYQFIFQEANFFQSSALTSEEMTILYNALGDSENTELGNCYYNAQTLAMGDMTKTIKYHEGLVLRDDLMMPIFHGFNSINNKVIDVTLDFEGEHIHGDLMDSFSYFGVEFDIKKSFERLSNGLNCTSFIENYDEGLPILKSKYKL